MKSKDQLILDKTCGHCWYCGKSLKLKSNDVSTEQAQYVADHAIPKCQGGTRAIENLLPSCWSCNSAKAGRTIEQYRIQIMLRKVDAPYFSPNQVLWMQKHGFDFSILEPHIFWGEQHHT